MGVFLCIQAASRMGPVKEVPNSGGLSANPSVSRNPRESP